MQKDKGAKFYKIDKDLNIRLSDRNFKNTKKNQSENNFILAKYMSVGYYIITPLLIGVFLGLLIDKVLNTKPIFILTLITLGSISSFYNLWTVTKR